jgi:hypothetical protein
MWFIGMAAAERTPGPPAGPNARWSGRRRQSEQVARLHNDNLDRCRAESTLSFRTSGRWRALWLQNLNLVHNDNLDRRSPSRGALGSGLLDCG